MRAFPLIFAISFTIHIGRVVQYYVRILQVADTKNAQVVVHPDDGAPIVLVRGKYFNVAMTKPELTWAASVHALLNGDDDVFPQVQLGIEANIAYNVTFRFAMRMRQNGHPRWDLKSDCSFHGLKFAGEGRFREVCLIRLSRALCSTITYDRDWLKRKHSSWMADVVVVCSTAKTSG